MRQRERERERERQTDRDQRENETERDRQIESAREIISVCSALSQLLKDSDVL